MIRDAKFSIAAVTGFYVPLLLQGFSQSLSYPLVAGIVSKGEAGVNALTAFSQGQMIMFMIGALGAGLVTTGLVFARTWYGYVSFRRLNALMMFALLALQCLPAIPPFDAMVFGGFFNLPPELAEMSRSTLLWGVFMNGAFFLRNVPITVLFNNLESGKANRATFARIALTFACAAAFPPLGLVGPRWGLLALTLGVFAETALTWHYARPYVRELRATACEAPYSVSVPALLVEQFRFTLPLALGGFLLATSPLVIAAFVARTANAADMLAIHYVTLGVANPVSYAALKMQTVAVKFPAEYAGDRRLLKYAVAAGAALGLVSLAFATPWLGDWYFGAFQNVPERIVPTARLAVGIYALIPIIHAVRGRVEGIAAYRKRPKAIMAGQIAYTTALFLSCLALTPTGVPGWAVALISIFVAPVVVIATVYAFLRSTNSAIAPSPVTLAAGP